MTTTVTSTIKSSGGDYTTLNAWNVATQVDLTVADQIQQAECYGMNDTTACTLSGATTDATRYRRVYAVGAAWMQMPYDTGGTAYRRTINGIALTVNEGYCRVEGIQCESTANTNAAKALVVTAPTGTTVTLRECFGRCLNATGPLVATIDLSGAGTVYCINCIADRGGSSTTGNGFLDNGGSGPGHYLYNCTAVNVPSSGYASAGSPNPLLKNCIGYGTGGGVDFNAGLAGSNNNASRDTSAPGSTNYRSIPDPFVSLAGGNYHIATEYAGLDLSADAQFAFSIDCDRETRPAGAWDVGADQVTPAAPPPPLIDIAHRRAIQTIMAM